MAHTPYKAQLEQFLAGNPTSPFSARTLAESFDNGTRDELGTLRGIESELRKAFADGRLVQYHDGDGELLTEADAANINSKRLRRPALYGLVGVTPPQAGVAEVAYSADTHADANGSAAAGADDTDDDDEHVADGEAASDAHDVDEAADEEQLELTLEQAVTQLRAYPPPGAVAPEWVDDRILRAWASLPGVSKHFVRGLDQTSGPEKFELIRAGVTRKLRGGWRSESIVAGNLALLCRTSSNVWTNTAYPALKHYLSGDDGVPPDELPQLAADPLAYYDNSEQAPEAVLLYALALGVDAGALEMIATDCANLLSTTKLLDKATAQQERIDGLGAEAIELRRAAKQADRDRRDAERQTRTLHTELEQLRAAQADAGSASEAQHTKIERELRQRAEKAEEQIERLETERIPELESELEGLEDARGRLEETQALAQDEQHLRTQAEQDATRHLARVRQLTDDLSRAASLPTDDAGQLFDALSRPIGQAARHAADRLAAGRARANDDLVLELASTVAQITRRLDEDLPDMETAELANPVTLVEPVDTTAPDSAANAGAPRQMPAAEPAVAEDVEASAARPADQGSGAPVLTRWRRRSSFKISPLGGAGEIGGSAILVSNMSGHTVLLDCGQRVRGEYGLDTEPQFHRSIGQDGRLHAILLSHAHIDHVGSLPVLHKRQSDIQDEPIPIYMTAPTRQLTQIMLGDSAKIQQKRSELDGPERGFLDYGVGTMEAAYRGHDVVRVMDDEFVREVDPGLAVRIPETDFIARFLPVAHVLGSCAIHLTDVQTGQTLLYTGDLGPFADPQATLPQYALAELLTADLVIMESTYGAPPKDMGDGKRRRRGLSGRESAIKQLCEAAAHAHDRGGCVLLPAFSLGRTQELAKLIGQAQANGAAPVGDIIVGGMGEKITHVYGQYSKGANAWARAETMPRVEELGGRVRARDIEFEDVVGEVLDGEFCYIVASPALLTSGWSRAFLDVMIDNPDHAVVMSGHIPKHAGNIPRLHMISRGDMIDLGHRTTRIQAQFKALKGLSAHVPSLDLRRFAKHMTLADNHVAFGMVHGDEPSQTALAQDVDEFDGASAQALYNGHIWQPSRP
jgi:metallo-beta-lactamase family protein